MPRKMQTAQSMIDALLAYEMDSSKPTDGRAVIRNERLAIHVRMQTGGDVRPLLTEARRVLTMWQAY